MSPTPGKPPQRPDLSPWYTLNRALASAKDTGSIFSHTMTFLAKVSGVKNGLLGLVDGQRGRLLVEAAAGPVLQRAKGNKCKSDEGACGEVMRNGSGAAIVDPATEPLLKGVTEEGQRAALSCICASSMIPILRRKTGSPWQRPSPPLSLLLWWWRAWVMRRPWVRS